MTDKELRKLKRAELLQLLLMQSRETERLKAKLEEAERQLSDRKILPGENGSTSQDALPEQVFRELKRERAVRSRGILIRSIVFSLIAGIAAAAIASVIFFPVLRIYGSAMNPALKEGDIVLAQKGSEFERGDIIAFYYNNKVLVKRVIAGGGDWVDMDSDGNVTVNGENLEEPYLQQKAFGETDIKLPFQVPESRIFVMGDNRAASLDSRQTSIGCLAEEQIIGKVFFRVWPVDGNHLFSSTGMNQ